MYYDFLFFLFLPKTFLISFFFFFEDAQVALDTIHFLAKDGVYNIASIKGIYQTGERHLQKYSFIIFFSLKINLIN